MTALSVLPARLAFESLPSLGFACVAVVADEIDYPLLFMVHLNHIDQYRSPVSHWHHSEVRRAYLRTITLTCSMFVSFAEPTRW